MFGNRCRNQSLGALTFKQSLNLGEAAERHGATSCLVQFQDNMAPQIS